MLAKARIVIPVQPQGLDRLSWAHCPVLRPILPPDCETAVPAPLALNANIGAGEPHVAILRLRSAA